MMNNVLPVMCELSAFVNQVKPSLLPCLEGIHLFNITKSPFSPLKFTQILQLALPGVTSCWYVEQVK